MSLAIKLDERYTYADYLQWAGGERWELIHGVSYNMTPAPPPRHQRVATELVRQIANFLTDKSCEVFAAPFDVRFPDNSGADAAVETVVQPDISVICDAGKIDERGCLGAPDLVVEILSEETAGRDEGTKFSLYERYGVREYWIVNPWDETVRVYALNARGKYDFPVCVTKRETARSSVIQGLAVDLGEVFPTEGRGRIA
jgi:Uma2 family endonuclease